MKTNKKNTTFWFVIFGTLFLVLLALPLVIENGSDNGFSFVTEVYAEGQGQGGGHGGGKGIPGGPADKGHYGVPGGKSIEDQIFRGGKQALAEDDDSDRPPWAGGNRELNPHRGDPNPTPGSKKGDIYGDLWVLVRDPVTGVPILVDGEYQVCLDAACTEVVLTVDGELPEGVTAAEVEIGRTNVVRSPSKVTDKALDTIIDKLAAATTVTVDEAGRLVLDGVAIDAPLENLALYIALLTADPVLNPVIDKLPDDFGMLAASLLAAGADKTGNVTIDYVVYVNMIMGVVGSDEYYNYDAFDYSRDDTYSGLITYYVQDPVTGEITTVTETILEAVFDGESYTSASGTGLTDFAQAADDALQVIEFVHTQIHTEPLL